jgi:hypothetical protein
MGSRFTADALIAQAVERAGSDDFGEPAWREGLDRYLESVSTEAQLNDLGVEIVLSDVVTTLSNRLNINAFRAAHPEVADKPIVQPIVIVGQPRTGTTILYDLLALDPALRAPLTWEVDHPCPPPEPATYRTDPRIAQVQAQLDLTDQLRPGFRSHHPIGATLAQECVRITAGDFRSMMYSVQYDIPSYNRWQLHEADMSSAYRWHRRYLQHLQYAVEGQWLLKSPAHLWHLDALAAEYPDAVVVQTHRDPLRVIASVSALAAHLRSLASDNATIETAAKQYEDDILFGLEQAMQARDAGAFPPSQIVDVQLTDFVREPFSFLHKLYAQLGRDLAPETEQRMRDFLAANPGDGGAGRYRWSDTGLDAGELRERVAAYQERYDVPSEALS